MHDHQIGVTSPGYVAAGSYLTAAKRGGRMALHWAILEGTTLEQPLTRTRWSYQDYFFAPAHCLASRALASVTQAMKPRLVSDWRQGEKLV